MQSHRNPFSCMRRLFCCVIGKFTNLIFPHVSPYGRRSGIRGEIVIVQSSGQPADPVKSAFIQICSATTVDPTTGKGKLSEKAYLRYGKSNVSNGEKTTTYKIMFRVEPGFGTPGALIITNQHEHEFFLKSASLRTPNNQTIEFDCGSWIYPFVKTGTGRVFFSNTKYLPNQTPHALLKLRKEELISMRGDGEGERKEWDRIYDYDYYNDLGNPDKGKEHARPVLGGSDLHPFPRRLRTGRPPSIADPSTESQPNMVNIDNIYVPPDECMSSKKMSEVISSSIQAAVPFLIHGAKSFFEQESSSFESFDEMHYIFSGNRSLIVEEWITENLINVLPPKVFKEITYESIGAPFKSPLPQIIAENELAWKSDEEFGRQMLAGTNPARIQRLEKFPPTNKKGKIGAMIESHIQDNLDGLSVAQAINQCRLFILDHHDYLMPFLERMNAKDDCVYASRTLLFLKNDKTLKPIAIELSLPSPYNGDELGTVFIPARKGEAAAMWQIAKAQVAANDSVYHQLISHWLQTHAVVEPFIIATRRQLSMMHPIHWLLHPHFKDTMHINALARNILMSSGGILEKTLYSAEISMELSAELYKDWRFDEQALPADLLKRGMAIKDPNPYNPTGVQLLFEDYPYGADGLEIWIAIKTWVTDFCSIFYTDDDSVSSDQEIQSWWLEIRNVGHGDKCSETWWYRMTTLSDLIQALTTLIWTASAIHASVNFGQYAYYGYPPNRPTLFKKDIPWEGTVEYGEFLKDPDKYYLKMLPGKLQMSLSVALLEVLSRHASDEVYLGQRSSSMVWINNEEVGKRFDKFSKELKQIEKRITERNRNPNLKNRRGPSGIPYTLLYPDTSNVELKGGITGKGIPNSISI
ncbi:hypothetical protein FEM48_Zijuj09G0205400 [Ziziphus jujuba var. spinosa]|uniref:Lipoxygenase n=1 Tax=Ziziphus jujuba var. spinosa TaxID=714518 RepID=A0A978UV61_ZIZJJ|nr:hypothetical protein FEM48_Zijuj09G0205400 [Ziziphus jujuba var. spinosa]